MTELRAAALQALACQDFAEKHRLMKAAQQFLADPNAAFTEPPGLSGRPSRPVLVAPRHLPGRPAGTAEGHIALIHSLAHIEFNAVNLALDACWRFGQMPPTYYDQWFRIALEEASHFELLAAHLALLGATYGDLPGHGGLWEMVEKTKEDVTARMALVPRTLEARGLDACPAVRDKLRRIGDDAGAKIIEVLLRDEIGHVAVGNFWYRWLCEQQGWDPLPTYDRLAHQYAAPRLRGPFNIEARRAAGFSDEELDAIQSVPS